MDDDNQNKKRLSWHKKTFDQHSDNASHKARYERLLQTLPYGGRVSRVKGDGANSIVYGRKRYIWTPEVNLAKMKVEAQLLQIKRDSILVEGRLQALKLQTKADSSLARKLKIYQEIGRVWANALGETQIVPDIIIKE